ncbi:MAG: beta-lactamase family protein [Rhizobacter sp.]|nr:beta-lactamase family protein [Ferruginibacter sp.]
MRHKITIGLLFLFNLTFGQNEEIVKLDGSKVSVSEIDKIINRLMDTANIQGVGLAVLNNKKTVFIKSYGYKNKPKNELLDTASIMYGASFSKAVFGYLTMKLVEEKILDLDKPLYQYLSKPIAAYEYFSDLKNDDRWKLITARMCLSHTTGLPNVRWFNPITSEQDTIGLMKIYFKPGTKYAYSGEGFKLLQLIEEEVTKKPLDELAVEKVFKPIGMTRTGYVWHNSFGDDNVAVGHMNNGDIDKKRKRAEAVAGGSLVTTISDYSRFIEHIMQAKGLTKKWFQEMIRPQINIHSLTQFPPITFETTAENNAIHLSYGLGWGLLECSNGKAFFKEGNGGAWKNYNINFIDRGISIIILINSENGETIFQELLETLIGKTCIPWKWQGYIPYNHTAK